MRSYPKTTLFSIFFFLGVVSATAQVYHPMVVEGTLRSSTQPVNWVDPDDPNNSSVENITVYYLIEGDTIIEGKNYKKIYEAKYPNPEDFYFHGGLREEDKRVYFKPRTVWQEELKVFDFTLNPGDTLFAGGVDLFTYIVVILTDSDSIPLTDNSYRRRMNFTAFEYMEEGGELQDSFLVFSWIEGIGKTNCVQWDDVICPYSFLPYHQQELLCYYNQDGSLLYSNPEYESCEFNTIPSLAQNNPTLSQINLFPNPIENEMIIDLPNVLDFLPLDVSIINATGKVVHHQKLSDNAVKISTLDFASGLYLVVFRKNGRNISAKQIVKR